MPDFGKRLSMDSKAISSFAKQQNKNQTPDGRRDNDADYGRKEYKGKTKEGKLWEKIVKWFGKGNVYCYCPKTNTRREMPSGGFEKDRNTLKKLCPAEYYGIECKGQAQCPVTQGIRISLSEDRRIFTPIDRASYKWEKEYDKRTSVERVNSRFDVSFGFELHTIRGMAKMKVRCGLALCVMLAMALGRVKEKQADKMRSLVRAV